MGEKEGGSRQKGEQEKKNEAEDLPVGEGRYNCPQATS